MECLFLSLRAILFVAPPHVWVLQSFLWHHVGGLDWMENDFSSCKVCLIVASNARWCAHVLPLYCTNFHLELQRFIFNGIMWIICCCHLELFYLWHHHTFRFCNLSCNALCEVWIGWNMTHSCNICIIVASHAFWCTHVSPSITQNFIWNCKDSFSVA